MPDPKTTVKRLIELGDEAHNAGLYAKAARFYRQARDLAAQARDELNRVKCLFWEGYCLERTGDSEAAMPLLLEAAYCRSPEADPADVFSAAARLIEISLDRKTAAYIRKVVADTREYLSRMNKTGWAHMLDLLEGELEYVRGNFQGAWPHFLRAREGERRNPYYPSYTQATYLNWICKTAFRLRDPDNLARWTETIEACEKEIEWDKVLAKRARLRLFRAERSQGRDFSPAADIALSALDMLEMFEWKEDASVIECLRALALSPRRDETLGHMARFRLTEDCDYFLFRGDERLCRARTALGMAVRDDEYDTDFPLPGPNTSKPDMPEPEKGLECLQEAAEWFGKARKEAEEEDLRLETDYWTRTLDERLARAKAMEHAVKEVANQ